MRSATWRSLRRGHVERLASSTVGRHTTEIRFHIQPKAVGRGVGRAAAPSRRMDVPAIRQARFHARPDRPSALTSRMNRWWLGVAIATRSKETGASLIRDPALRRVRISRARGQQITSNNVVPVPDGMLSDDPTGARAAGRQQNIAEHTHDRPWASASVEAHAARAADWHTRRSSTSAPVVPRIRRANFAPVPTATTGRRALRGATSRTLSRLC
jgi:hypothetical protein